VADNVPGRKALTNENFPGGRGALRAGGFFDPLAKQGPAADGNAPARSFSGSSAAPAAPRATLVERDNTAEVLPFHFNPSSYKIGKVANWSEKSAGTGPRTLEWGGPGLTKVTFTALFNTEDIHPLQSKLKSVEESFEWLFQRMDNREASSANRRIAAPPRRVSWMNGPNVQAGIEPPVLVLFGVSHPFVCRLKSANVTTFFQSLGAPAGVRPPANTSVGELRRYEADQRALSANKFRENVYHITRATVALTFLEYNKTPKVQGG